MKAAAREVLTNGGKTTDHHLQDQPANREEGEGDTGPQSITSSQTITGEEPQGNTMSQSGQNTPSSGASQADKTSGRHLDEGAEGADKIEGITEGESAGEAELANLASEMWQVVKRYPSVYHFWLANQVKSATIHEIVEVTNQPKRRVQYQVGRALKTAPRNENLILVSSVIEWLKTAPIPEQTSRADEAEITVEKAHKGIS